MLLNNQKKLAYLIIGKAKPGEFSQTGYEEKARTPEKTDSTVALEACATKAMEALKANDVQMFLSAMKSLFVIFENTEDETEGE